MLKKDTAALFPVLPALGSRSQSVRRLGFSRDLIKKDQRGKIPMTVRDYLLHVSTAEFVSSFVFPQDLAVKSWVVLRCLMLYPFDQGTDGKQERYLYLHVQSVSPE